MAERTFIQDPASADPREQGPPPPYHQEQIAPPGLESQMTVKPDHGEESYQGSGRLRGKTALITGGDSGIGRAVALAFAREGADVAISYLPVEDEDGRETTRWIEKAGRRSLRLPGDIQSERHCEDMVQAVRDEFGVLDLLINVAAFQRTHDDINEISTAEFDQTMKTNVYALFWLCRAALRTMAPGAGIVNTTSIQAYDPSANLLAYATTKGAIANFTKGLSTLAMKQGVRVNAVAPGPVWTPLIPSTMPAEKVKKFGETTEFGRAAQPVEIAPVYVFLASNEARFVTGEVYGVTGGQSPY